VTNTGCVWIVAHAKRWDSVAKKYFQVPIFCHKIPASQSQFCPKHQLFAEEKAKQEAAAAQTYAEGR
jgi:hypothetical protein